MNNAANPAPSTHISAATSHEDTLAAWLNTEREVMARVKAGIGPGLLHPDQAANRTGLQIMESLMSGELPYTPLADLLNFCAVEVAEGRVVFQGAPAPVLLNPMGSIHGGWISTVLDSAMGSTLLASLPENHSYVTSNLNVNFIKSLTLRTRRVRAEATIMKSAGRSAQVNGKLYGPDGTVFAEAVGDFRVFATGPGPVRNQPPAST